MSATYRLLCSIPAVVSHTLLSLLFSTPLPLLLTYTVTRATAATLNNIQLQIQNIVSRTITNYISQYNGLLIIISPLNIATDSSNATAIGAATAFVGTATATTVALFATTSTASISA